MTRISNAKQSGFTLLEMLVVLAIIAIATGLLMPNLAITDNAAFNAEIRKAVATLNYAKRMAIVQAMPAIAEFRSEDSEPAAVTEPAEDQNDRNSFWFSEQINLGFQTEFERVPQATPTISLTFFPQGGSTGGTLFFTQNQRQAMIRVDPITGRIETAYSGEELADEN